MVTVEQYTNVTFSVAEACAVVYALKEEAQRGREWLDRFDPMTSDLPFSTVQILCETQMHIENVIRMLESSQWYAIIIPEGVPGDGAKGVSAAAAGFSTGLGG